MIDNRIPGRPRWLAGVVAFLLLSMTCPAGEAVSPRYDERWVYCMTNLQALSNFKAWDAAAKDIPSVVGFMYTTCAYKYGLLESSGAAIEAARRP